MDEIIRKVAEAFDSVVERELARNASELEAAMNSRGPLQKLVFIASMSMVVNAMLPQLAEPEKRLYDLILKQTSTVVGSVPRKKEE